MSGHSKWANIKHKKAAADAKKGKAFSKIAREIFICVKSGGGDPNSNITLRALLQKAKSVNMPSDNIERAIKKGTGELEGETLEERMFEGFAPGGVAVIVHALTDNHNRTTAEIRLLFNRHGGNLAQGGSVSRGFKRKGQIIVDASKVAEDKLMELALEAGAEDMQSDDGTFEIITDPAQFMNVVDALNKANVPLEGSEITMLPATYVAITDKAQAAKFMAFVDALDDLDDVQNVYNNADIDPSLIEG